MVFQGNPEEAGDELRRLHYFGGNQRLGGVECIWEAARMKNDRKVLAIWLRWKMTWMIRKFWQNLCELLTVLVKMSTWADSLGGEKGFDGKFTTVWENPNLLSKMRTAWGRDHKEEEEGRCGQQVDVVGQLTWFVLFKIQIEIHKAWQGDNLKVVVVAQLTHKELPLLRCHLVCHHIIHDNLSSFHSLKLLNMRMRKLPWLHSSQWWWFHRVGDCFEPLQSMYSMFKRTHLCTEHRTQVWREHRRAERCPFQELRTGDRAGQLNVTLGLQSIHNRRIFTLYTLKRVM